MRFACSVGRKDKVLGSLHNWNEVRKAEALPGCPVQERTRRAKPPVKRHCWVSNPGSPVYKTGALTSYATAPCWIQLSLAAAEGWFANQIASGTGAPLHHWRFSAPPFAFRSRIEKPLSPRWCSSTPSKGTAGIRTQDLLFTRQVHWPVMPRRLLDPAFFGCSWGVVCKPNRQRHWRSSAPPFAFRSRIKKNHEAQDDARARLPKAPLGFEPRISCLLNRRFNQLSHGASLQAEGWFANQIACGTGATLHPRLHSVLG